VQLLLDVRAVPLSRKAGFSKSVLAASLAARGIGYLNDKRLGTPKPGRDAARKGHTAEMARIFEAHLQGEAPREALREAASLAQGQRICLLCFERAPHDCHRAIVAARIHQQTGLAIRHL
jgi:uncharacterized protein (DUF488 family)